MRETLRKLKVYYSKINGCHGQGPYNGKIGIDGSQFGLGNQELWLKQNFPKMEKMTISGPKRWNLAKNWWTSGA
jgi:hypothetical protein